MSRLTTCLALAAALLALAGCGQSGTSPLKFSASPLQFSEAVTRANQRIARAGEDFGKAAGAAVQSGQPADAARVDQAYAELLDTLAAVQEEMKALKVPEGASARAFYDAHQRFLAGQERLIKTEFVEITTVVKNPAVPPPLKQARIAEVIGRVQMAEQADLGPLQEAQKKFAADHNITLR